MIPVLTDNPVAFIIGLGLTMALVGPFAAFAAAVVWAIERGIDAAPPRF